MAIYSGYLSSFSFDVFFKSIITRSFLAEFFYSWSFIAEGGGRQLKKYSLFLIGIFLLPIIPVQAQESFDELRHPVAEVINLLVDGSTPVLINLTLDFFWVARVVWTLDFVSNQLLFTGFAGGNALANGVQVLHDGVSILGNGAIKQNHEFGHASFDVKVLSDEAGTRNRMLLSRWGIDAVVPPYGIRFISNESFQFLISDNLTVAGLAITDFTVSVGGFRTESILTENSDLSEFFLIEVINWWGFFLYQNVFVLLAAVAVTIVIIKLFRE